MTAIPSPYRVGCKTSQMQLSSECNMVLTTPGIPRKPQEFWNFLLGLWKTPGKADNISILLENSWNFEETFLSVFKTNRNLQKHLIHDCTFCILCRLNFSYCYCGRNYLMSYCFCREKNLGCVLENFILYFGELQKNSWNFVIIS